MEDFEKILLRHFEKYPIMTPQDAVKLCFQSAFGCGHLVKGYDFALSMLKDEMKNIEGNIDAQCFDDIGGGYIRFDLHYAKAKGIAPQTICKVFVESANCGIKTDIDQKLNVLKKLAEKGKTPFSNAKLSEYLSGYNGEVISHSEKYKAAYTPAYRVILKNLAENLQ